MSYQPHTNTHKLDATCIQHKDTVVGKVDGVQYVGVSFAFGGWKPARPAREGDINYILKGKK